MHTHSAHMHISPKSDKAILVPSLPSIATFMRDMKNDLVCNPTFHAKSPTHSSGLLCDRPKLPLTNRLPPMMLPCPHKSCSFSLWTGVDFQHLLAKHLITVHGTHISEPNDPHFVHSFVVDFASSGSQIRWRDALMYAQKQWFLLSAHPTPHNMFISCVLLDTEKPSNINMVLTVIPCDRKPTFAQVISPSPYRMDIRLSPSDHPPHRQQRSLASVIISASALLSWRHPITHEIYIGCRYMAAPSQPTLN